MPIYIFSNPNNPSEIIEVLQNMNEEHIYIRNGEKWNREWTKPQATIDTNIDPTSRNDFCEKTKKKNYTFGDTQDLAAEASRKREKIYGRDPVKEKTMAAYEKKTGKPHPERHQKKDIYYV